MDGEYIVTVRAYVWVYLIFFSEFIVFKEYSDEFIFIIFLFGLEHPGQACKATWQNKWVMNRFVLFNFCSSTEDRLNKVMARLQRSLDNTGKQKTHVCGIKVSC